MRSQHGTLWAVASLLSGLVLATPARAADNFSWGFLKLGKSEVSLSYGVSESDIVTLVFACDTKKNRIEIVTTVLPPKRRNGQALRTTLHNGAATAVYDGKVVRSTWSGEFHFEVSMAAEPKAMDIVKSGSSLVIGIPGRQVRVPLKGVTKPLAQFEAACFRKR